MELIEIIYSVAIFFTLLLALVFSFSFIGFKIKQKNIKKKNEAGELEKKRNIEAKHTYTQHNVPVIKTANVNSNSRTTQFHKHQHKLQQTKEVKRKAHTIEKLRKHRVERIVDLTQKNVKSEVKKMSNIELPKQKITKTNTLDGNILNKYIDGSSNGLKSITKE